MINKNRIVPVMKSDLLSLYGTILTIANVSYTVLASKDVKGTFKVTGSGAAGTFLADQPVETLDFASGVTGGTVYFVADYDFSAITVAGAAATLASASLDLDEVEKDAGTLYKAVLSSGEVTISAVSPVVA